MKKIIATGLLGLSTSLMAMYGEQSYVYKDARILGMGGANVAVGGYSTSIFSNPAGLKSLKKEDGFIVELLGLQIGATEQFQDFSKDLGDALDEDDDAKKTEELIGVLQKYNGEHFHANVSNYTSLSKNSDMFAWSIGILAGADLNYMTHSDGSVVGPSLETSSRGYGGLVLGAAKDYSTRYGTIDVGVSGKYIVQKSYEGQIPLIDLIDKDSSELQTKYEKESSGFAVDVGVVYHPAPNNYWHPAVGLSVLNIGSIDMDDQYGKQAMSVNLGASITPEVSFLDKLVVAVDYVDMFNANEARYYKYVGGVGDTVAVDVEDSELMKRVRFGAMAQVIDSKYFALALSGGMYEGAWSAGVDMALTILKLSLTSYEEDLGYGSFELTDRRYALQLGLGW